MFLCLQLFSFAQDSTRINVYSSDFFLFDKQTKSNFLEIDTLQNNLPNYMQRNRIGSIGVPDYGLLLSNKEYDLGALWFKSGYDNAAFGLQEQNYFSNKKIATSLFGAAGSKKEQFLKLSHVQNVNEDLNFTLKLNRITSENFYQYQQSFVNNVLFSSHYLSKKSRVGYLAKFSFDRFKHADNGGVTSDTSIVEDVFVNKILLPVHLKSAKRDYNIMTGEAKLFFRLNKDSLSHKGHYINLGASGSITKTEYNDDASAVFYDTAYQNQFVTHDSVRFSKLVPTVGYSFVAKRFSANIDAKYDISRFADMDTSRVYESAILDQQLAWISGDSNLVVKEKFNYIVSGFNSGNYKGILDVKYNLNFLKSSIALKLQSEQRSQDLFFKYFNSNNYYWSNQFNANQSNLIDANISSQKLRLQLGACVNMQNNISVLGANNQPMQLNSAATALRVYMNHTLKVFRFYLVNKLNYQTSNSNAWALPSIYTQHQLYYQHLVKKNGMILQAGVQADYVGVIDLIQYNPALNSFAMDYATKKGGNYVFADVFFTLRFKEVSFFFRTEHLNQGFSGANFSLLQNYYQRDRAFRFGLNWDFRD
ncbi:MAG: hypothetical protein IPG89_16295 [Bacteroidetes bacterium]|nr:hypothetical protein [Bacteroidota bacterium]